MDELFYFGVVLLSIGLIALSNYWFYKLGEKNGAKKYYNILTTPYEKGKIQ